MSKPLAPSPWLLAVITLGAAGHARADVIFEEPTQLTCGRAAVIVAGKVVAEAAPGPFTNGAPLTVKLIATRCWKGCKAGDALTVVDWVEPRPSHSGKPRPVDPAAEEAAWKAQAVTPPAPGTVLLLFLYRDGEKLRRVHDSGGYGGHVMRVGASVKEVARAAAMCEVAVTIAGERDRVGAIGKPLPVHLEVSNLTDGPVAFHAADVTLKLQTDTRPGEDLLPAGPPPAPPLPHGDVRLEKRATRTFDWDLGTLFPGAFSKPGNYWLTLDAPAALGQHWIAIRVQ